MRTFKLLVANTLVASTTNMYLWFALTFWVYLETRSVTATSIIGGGYMLLFAASGLAFGSYVDRHGRKSSMVLSTALSLVLYALASAVYLTAGSDAATDLGHPAFWALVVCILGGAIAGNLRAVALSTCVSLLVPDDEHDKANGLVGTVNGVSFSITSLFSGLSIGQLGMGWTLGIGVGLTAAAAAHLIAIPIPNDRPDAEASDEVVPTVDVKGALRAVRVVPGLIALIFFSTFNNLLGGAFMALMDPYALMLVSVEAWGILLAVTSSGFIVGGILVSTRGLGRNPVRTLLLTNVAMWIITVLFPLRASIVPVAIGFLVYSMLIPRAEASEQTVIQRVVPIEEQGRVFGFAQSVETASSPVTSFLLGPLTQIWVMPFMTDGAGADAIGGWFGRGPDRGIALVFVVTGVIGLVATGFALRSAAYRTLSDTYAKTRQPAPAAG